MVHNQSIDAGAHVEWAGFLSGVPVIVTVEGEAITGALADSRTQLVDGLAAVCMSRDGQAIICAGEDGRLVRFSPVDGLAPFGETGGWVDAIACGPADIVAVSLGKKVRIFGGASDGRIIELERTAEALCFAPKGVRLAIARYDGVELHWVNSGAAAQTLEWQGAHIDVAFSPDGRYVVSAMQENALHGWQLSDAKHMRMTGYPAKVKSISWSAKGKWLASTGAPAAIVWPFSGKDGPMGKAPRELGSMGQVMTSQVACHPGAPVVAIGYANGMIAAVRIEDGEIAMLRNEGKGPIAALGWSGDGKMLAFGSAEGEGGIIDVTA